MFNVAPLFRIHPAFRRIRKFEFGSMQKTYVAMQQSFKFWKRERAFWNGFA